MPPVTSAGLLMFYSKGKELKVFLVHPGGPFFRNKNNGWWGVPKGLPETGEELLSAAVREFEEETGIKPSGEFIPLGNVVQKSGKVVHCWAFSSDNDAPVDLKCNTFNIEWPPKSGKYQAFPEVDEGHFFTIPEAEIKINSAQKKFLERLTEHLQNKGS